MAQASLMYGIVPMWSVAITMMLYHLNLAFSGKAEKIGRYRMIAVRSGYRYESLTRC